MRVGLQHVRQSPRMRAVIVRVFLFFLQASALLALLPLVARQLHGGGAGIFTLLMACMGGGAIAAALWFPRWRQRFDRDQFVVYGTLVHAASTALVALVPEIWVAVPGCFIAGMAWISTANTLAMSAQLALPNWVRARGMSIYQMALMGGTAFGAMLFGKVAGLDLGADGDPGGRGAGCAGAAADAPLLGGRRRGRLQPRARRALAPDVAIEIGPDEGPVMVTVEYRIDPARAADFAAVMQLTRAARLRQGALSWGLFRDTAVPGRYVEYFVDESWVEHQRRLERFTAADAELRAQRLAFHLGAEPPLLRRYVADSRASCGLPV